MRQFCTENPDFGFYGTISLSYHDPRGAFDAAAREVAKVCGVDGLDAAGWLDSREGRHFAVDVLNELPRQDGIERAIHAAVGRWLSWNISPSQSAQTGIPAGIPYLVGVVYDFARNWEG